MTTPAPPLGIEPRFMWIEKRIEGLIAAMGRYSDAGLPTPKRWLEEMDQLILMLRQIRYSQDEGSANA